MPARHRIEKAMRKLRIVVRKKGESDESFLMRAASACDLPEARWNELPSDVQEWANLAIEACLRKEIPPFFSAVDVKDDTAPAEAPKIEEAAPVAVEEAPVVVPEEPKEEPPAEVEKEEPVAAKKTAAKKVAARKPAPKKTAAKKATKTAAKKTTAKTSAATDVTYNSRKGKNAHDQFRQMAIDFPTATRKELREKAEKARCGLSKQSMSACIYHVDAVLRVLRDRGFKVPEVARSRAQNAAAKAAAKKATKKTARKRTTKK